MHRFALIGKSLKHSFSPSYFKSKFEENNITNLSYSAQELENIDDLPAWLKANEEIKGFNVTIPYKQSVCQYIDELYGPAAGLNIVNTVVVERNIDDFEGQKIPGLRLKGFNTDIYGFKESIKPLMRPWFERALILGTGASAGSIAYVLYKLGVDTLFVSRSPEGEQEIGYEDINDHVIRFHPLIINTSPVGQFPDDEQLISLPYQYITDKHLLYDLVYNPDETAFLKAGKKQGAMIHNGLSMLQLQADQSLKTWMNALNLEL
ncbi:MAG: shikimate dehydrogenase [Bacteroidia bacterium]